MHFVHKLTSVDILHMKEVSKARWQWRLARCCLSNITVHVFAVLDVLLSAGRH